jgi:hypothetical protein
MHHGVHFAGNIDVIGNIVLKKAEVFVARQVGNVFPASRDKVVHANDFMPICQQAVTQMGA